MLITQANSGNADAQNNLGAFYCKPEGSNVDCSEAVKWYSKAAEQGHSLAQSNLGGLYAEGRGVLKDYIIAYKWFNLAAAQNNYHAIKSRDVIEKSMTAEQIAEGQRLSREWLVRIGQ
jgi:TPR repeat protein